MMAEKAKTRSRMTKAEILEGLRQALVRHFPAGHPTLPPELYQELEVQLLYPELAWVAGPNVWTAALMMNEIPGCRVAMSDPVAASVERARGSVTPIGASLSNTELPAGAVDWILGVNIGSSPERDGYLTEVSRVGRAGALLVLVERGRMQANSRILAAVDRSWRDAVDPSGFPQPDLGWIKALPDWHKVQPDWLTNSRSLLYDPEAEFEGFFIRGDLTARQLAEELIANSGINDACGSLHAPATERLQCCLADAFNTDTWSDDRKFEISWPIVVRARRLQVDKVS